MIAIERAERARARFALLSTAGAGVAGVGIGAMLARPLANIAWALAAIGLVVHLMGMFGARRAMASAGYVTARWENVGYFACWLLIAVAIAFAAIQVLS